MCVVSMVGDHYNDKWKDRDFTGFIQVDFSPVRRYEFEQLKKEVEEMKELLIRAKIYDEKNGEPDCEIEDKVELLKKVAEIVGVDLEEVFGRNGK